MYSTSKTQFPEAVPMMCDYYLEWYANRELAESLALEGDYVPPVDEMADIMFARMENDAKQVMSFLADPYAWLQNEAEFPESADPRSCSYFENLIGEVMERVMDECIHPEMVDWIVHLMNVRRTGAANQFNWQQFCNQLAA